MLKNKCFNKAIILLMALFFGVNTFAQSDKLGTWNIANVQYNFNKKWNAFFEGQLRSQKTIDDFNYHELKAGIGYNASDKFAILLGNGFYQTYNIGGDFKSPVTSSEYRIWEQLVVTNNIDRLKLEHRYRAEQRWLSNGFSTRFRYRLNALVPFNKPKIEKGTFYASVYDELFITDKGPHLQRNRFFAGLGYQLDKHFTFQFGFIRQSDFAVNSRSAKNSIQTTFLFNIHQQSDREQHPSSMD